MRVRDKTTVGGHIYSLPLFLPRIFYETKINQTASDQKTIINFNYPIEAEPLSNNHSYVWQVQAFDNYGRPVGGVHGKSKIYQFKIEQISVHSSEVEIILEFKKQ